MKDIKIEQVELDALMNWHRDREAEAARGQQYRDAEWHKRRIGELTAKGLQLPPDQKQTPPSPECGPPITLKNCPTGLFMFDGQLCFKAETHTENVNTGFLQTDAYTVPGGEYFWGKAPTSAERESLIVRPVIWQDLEGDLSGRRLLQRVYDAITGCTGVHGDMLNEIKEFLS
jgi:hypothetical protein